MIRKERSGRGRPAAGKGALGVALVQARRGRGWTRKRAALEMGIPIKTLEKIENGVIPQAGTAARILAKLPGVPIPTSRRRSPTELLEAATEDRKANRTAQMAAKLRLAERRAGASEDAAEMGRFQRELGAWYLHHGESDRALGCMHRALELALASGDEELEGRVRNGLGVAQISLGEGDPIRELERAIQLAHGRSAFDEGTAVGNLAIYLQGRGAIDEARARYREAIRLHADFPERRVKHLGNLASLESRSGSVDAAKELYDRVLALQSDLGDLSGLASTHGNLGIWYKRRGRPDQAEHHYRKAIQLWQELKNPRSEAIWRGNYAALLHWMGRRSEALTEYLSARDAHAAVGNRRHLAIVEESLADLRIDQGRLDEAERHCRLSLQCYEDGLGIPRNHASALTTLGWLRHRQDRLEEAEAALEQARDVLGPTENDEVPVVMLLVGAAIDRARGRSSRAAQKYRTAARLGARLHSAELEGQALLGLAVARSGARSPAARQEGVDALRSLARLRTANSAHHPELWGRYLASSEVVDLLLRIGQEVSDVSPVPRSRRRKKTDSPKRRRRK